jgi:uncharacterized protein YjbJ (UPF0337 family)
MFVNTNPIKERAKEGKGKIKEVTRYLVSNGKLVTKGKIEKSPGRVQVAIHDTSLM